MNLQNPTQLHLGMKATFLEREYKLLGRVVMGVHDAGEWYFWNEFNLVSDDGAMAILVYEEDEHGLHWRIFTQFDPEFPMTVADAAAVRVGKTLNLNGTDVKVTLVDKSTVKQIEGRAPHGTVMGSVENYFNALGGGLMQVVSWTATKVEYYNGCDLSPEDVAVAFDIPLEKVAVASWRLPRQLHEEQQEDHQQQEEQELGDAHGRAGDAAEPKSARDQRDHQENQSPLQHAKSPWPRLSWINVIRS